MSATADEKRNDNDAYIDIETSRMLFSNWKREKESQLREGLTECNIKHQQSLKVPFKVQLILFILLVLGAQALGLLLSAFF